MNFFNGCKSNANITTMAQSSPLKEEVKPPFFLFILSLPSSPSQNAETNNPKKNHLKKSDFAIIIA